MLNKVNSSRLGGLCTDQSSNFGVDHSDGRAPKDGRLGGRASVSGGSQVRVAEEGRHPSEGHGGLRPRSPKQ